MQLATKNTLYNAYTFNTDLDESGRSNSEGSNSDACDGCMDADDMNPDIDSPDNSCDPPAAKEPAVSSSQCTDVAKFVGTRISSADRYQLLVSHFKPGANYSFPKSSNSLSLCI